MAYNITGVGTANVDADNFVPELWSAGVQNYIKKKFLLANLVNDVSFMVSNAGDTINILVLQKIQLQQQQYLHLGKQLLRLAILRQMIQKVH